MQAKKLKGCLSVIAAVSFVFGGAYQIQAGELADMVYHNGTIYTMTETKAELTDVNNAKTVEVVVTKSGKILFAGSKADAKTAGYFDAAKVDGIVDLGGKTMLPGFVDGHGHFPGQGSLDLFNVNLNSPPLGKMTSIDDYIRVLSERAAITAPGEWVQGWGYDDTLIKEMRHPTKEELDKVSTTHPVYISHISGHMGVANTVALNRLSEDEKKVEGVMSSGLLLEMAAMAVITNKIPKATGDMNQKGVARASQVYAAAGVTTADQGGSQLMSQLPELQIALANNRLGPRVITHPLGYYHSPIGDQLGYLNRLLLGWKSVAGKFDQPGSLKNGDDLTSYAMPPLAPGMEFPAPAPNLPQDRVLFGAWKFIFDGSNQGYTGWFKNPGYYDWGNSLDGTPRTGADSFDPTATSFIGLPGTLNFPASVLEEQIAFYHSKGQSTETHTNGSAAAEAFVTALEKAVLASPDITDTRHTSIHGQMMERQHVERLIGKYDSLPTTQDMYTDKTGPLFPNGTYNGDLAATLGPLMKKQHLVTSYFINHTYFWGDRHLDIFMGPGRAKNINPVGWSAYYNHDYTLHNDTQVTPISPLRSVHSATTRVSFGGRDVFGSSTDINAKTQYAIHPTANAPKAEFWDFDQRVNVLQALHGVTIAPAYQNKIEDRVGSIAPGKYADLVILDENPFDVWAKKPLAMADLRVATTIRSDEVIHGVLPGSTSFVGQFQPAFEQPAGVSLKNVQFAAVAADYADKNYAALPKEQKRLGTISFTTEIADTGTTSVGLFQFTVLGNGGPVQNLFLHKLHANKLVSYTYGKPVNLGDASGKWWLYDAEEPTVALTPEAVLVMDKTYTVTFGIKDNDLEFDTDATAGIIKDPVSLTTAGALPINGGTTSSGGSSDDGGGSSSGCTVNTGSPAYDLFILLAGLLTVAGIRSIRRRGLSD